jgi:hypothetical protein
MMPEQARTMTCCSSLRGGTNAHGLCVGDTCMAWRWEFAGHEPAPVDEKGKPIPNSPLVEIAPTRGTCGLVGE